MEPEMTDADPRLQMLFASPRRRSRRDQHLGPLSSFASLYSLAGAPKSVAPAYRG